MDTPSEASLPRCFPFVHSGEPDLPRHLRVRAEGVPLGRAILNGLAYLRKYRSSKRTAPAEEIRYFDQQREIIRALSSAEPPKDALRLGLVGDIMWLRNGWSSFLDPALLEHLNGHDVVLGNLETPVSSRFKVPSFWPDYFTYNSDPSLLTSFRRPSGASTFTALATCNNHSLDRGDEGLADTLAMLESLGIAHIGVRPSAEERAWISFEGNGIRFGLYAACWGLNDPASLTGSRYHVEIVSNLAPRVVHPVDLTQVRRALSEMHDAKIDFKIVALHWGYEFEFYPCPDIMRVGREVIEAGADLIVGTHPHVVQPLEVCFVNGYEQWLGDGGHDLAALSPGTGCVLRDRTGVPRKALIAYSLGNFTTAMYTLHCRTGLALSLSLARDAAGRVDWHMPHVHFVHNLARDPTTGRRRLTLLDCYLEERERRGEREEKLRDLATFLRQHLAGM